MADKHVVFDVHTFTDERVARNLAVLSNSRVLLDLHEGADFRFVANFAAIEINELGKFDVSAEFYTWGNT